MIKNNFLAKKLIQQRGIKGLNKRQLADLLEITPQAISQYEVGHTTPSSDIIIKMSNVLDVTVRFFFIEPLGAREYIKVFFRSLASATKSDREKVVRYNDYIQDFLSIFSQYINFPKVDLPSFEWLKPNSQGFLDAEQIEKVAIELRDYWGIGTRPIADMVKLLESKGIIVIRKQFDCQKIDAVSWWQPSINRPIIFLSNDKNNAVKSRFDIAHELGHLILHSNIEEITKENLKIIEKEANRFASAFLLPRSSFSQEIFSSSLEQFMELKKRWKVSIQAMIYRCDDLELLSENQILYLRKQINHLGMTRRDSLDEIIPIEKPVIFEKAIIGIIENNLLSKADFEEKLGLSGKNIEKLFDLPKGLLSEKETDNVVYLDFKNTKRET
jgi:Zn-dependent peptidase ImmA (M78 family)/DNA-binding XRE family transcriptional regulator